ncbi:STAS domain-containing protein [Thalassobacillus pellis]|uniref:STAS domain-containing protein n=1 Tax=Thalassobacillus pellis TaxID=748008 RepID=UPI00195FC197|nr:STAS domain-containing protein [Thalassobacillus pellis]MBM7554215.1 anti-anti-sigma regulatory factor [Thalassobacillus pellis]
MSKKHEINVAGLEFSWNINKGQFLYEGEEAVLFWITSAMKSFLDTIEEISGEEAANLVLETTGFRQGTVVGNYFASNSIDIHEVAEIIPDTYASAGWGLARVTDIDIESQTLCVHLKNDWEYKINKAQGKKTGGTFLPAHYAGIFTGMFQTNIWYEVEHSQLEGYDESVIRYFPSEINVQQNIHQLIRKKEAEQIIHLEGLVEDKTRDLKELVKTLSSPIIPVLEGIVVVPLLGRYDEERAEELISQTLQHLPKHKAEFLILDLTGINNLLTPYTISFIEKMGSTASLIGIKLVLVGISPKLAQSITETSIDLSPFDCFQNLQHGIHYALAQKGRKIV